MIKHQLVLQVFHLVCRIAGTLLQLQHAGHTKYISWSLSFTCSTVSTDTLRNQAITMEKELSNSLDLINEQRHHFHALNYFTTQQVLQIRHELGSLKQNKAADVTPQLLSLLTSFSLQISASDIKNIVKESCTLFSEQVAIEIKEENEVSEVMSLTVSEDKVVAEETYDKQLVDDEHVENDQKSLDELIQDLSEDEEELFVQLHDLGYSKIVCYKAVQYALTSTDNASNDDILDTAMDWCFDNSNQYDQSNDTLTSLDGSNKLGTVSSNEEMISDQSRPSEVEETALEGTISISHYVVQELLKLGFTPELSLKGAKVCNGNFEQAAEWCLNAETESTTEQPLFGSFDNSISLHSLEEAIEPTIQ